MIQQDWISVIEIVWVGAVFCIFSRQVGIWRREETRQKNKYLSKINPKFASGEAKGKRQEAKEI